LATHRCGTCFFFQEAGFAGNGWCLHADRAKSAEVRALVRRNELACRNDWGQSLWTDPKAAVETGASRNLISAQAERPATEGEIGFMVKNRDGQVDQRRDLDTDDEGANETGEDVLLGQFSVMPTGHTGTRRLVDQVPADIAPRGHARPEPDASADRWPETSERAVNQAHANEPETPDPSIDTREAIRRARDQFRQRSVGPRTDGPSERVSRPTVAGPPDRLRPSDYVETPASSVLEDETRRPDGRPTIERPTAPAERPEAQPGGGGSWSASDDLSAEQQGSFRIRTSRPAPIPGPVPARELRPDAFQREVRPGDDPERHQRPLTTLGAERGDHTFAPRASRHLPEVPSEAESAAAPPSRRRALPDLSDDFFTRGVLTSDHDSGRETAPEPGRIHENAPSPGRPEGGERSRTVERPVMAEPHRFHPSMASEGEAASVPVIRTRPAIPRPTGDRVQPTSAVVRTVPTVAEVSQAYRTATDPRPTPPAGPAIGQPRSRPRQAPAGPAGREGNHDRPTPVGDQTIPEPQPSVLEPPTLLRPQEDDFGEYGGWFDLQSVEPRLSPNLQRACETCRDFRPSENGERGWCTNRDAFTLRTVVNASDLPCISSFGCWWVPFDDIWLSEAAIRNHRNPTPLLDQLAPADESTVSGRQRRRS
jgi:hypothetical protein